MEYVRLYFIITIALLQISASGQAGTEIYLFDLKISNGQIAIANGKNITQHKGYDNQPFFHPSKPIIYFSSFNDSGRSDIKYYNYETGETKNLTVTHDREYSPTVTPDGEFVSCILQKDNGAQELVRYPIGGGKPEVLVWHLKVGYHAWTGMNKVFLFVLDDSIHNSLHNYDVSTNMDTVIAENVGRSLFKVPWENTLSYIQKLDAKQSVIKKFDLATGISSPIILMLPGQEYFCWMQSHTGDDQRRTLFSANGSKIFFYHDNSFTEFREKKWEEVIVEGNYPVLKGITRLAVNADNTKMAIVVNE